MQPSAGTILITGGAGFIGCNAAGRFVDQGHRVVVIDDLSREGSRRNLDWLCKKGHVDFCLVDVRNGADLERIFEHYRDASMVLHLAAQVAVTTSVTDPRTDFEINALGSLNVLEAARKAGMRCPILYSSTNKVYGGLDDLEVEPGDAGYRFAHCAGGVGEERPLDFHSPYGCSKGSADQYFRDYYRIYGLNTVVFRQSCVYGYRQFGVEDQGWVAWFLIAAETGRAVTVYGDGQQVRDVLFVDDLIDAYEAAARNIGVAAGNVYNVGGGPANTLSLRRLLGFIERQTGKGMPHAFADWRPGDQRVYISDIRRAEADFGWRPRVGVEEGLEKLGVWVRANRELFQ